ncbi:pilus assembly protein PilM [Patescibacteria group bacterium]|nr:pilus assembly protein PilM [Patescibacteria group bacterium]MBU1683581.1 pilus assembly protein PilM [Patescibacteria group bacterium]MBU1935483.1 pilus assembly protein PilM [Patescibacteria group bacterium]
MDNTLKNTFGLAISNEMLTAVELAYNKSGLKVINFSKVDLEPGVVENNCIIINPLALKEALSKLLQEAKMGPIKSENVIISIPEEKTFNHHIDIPKEQVKNKEFIKNVARDFIPIALDDAIIDYKQIRSNPGQNYITFNFVAVQKNIIDSLTKVLSEANLNVVAVDIDKNSIIRSCNNSLQKNEGDFMVVNIGMNKSTINITTSSGFYYNIDAKIEGKKLDEKIKELLKIPSIADVRTLLMQFSQDENVIKADQKKILEQGLQSYFATFIKKINELIQAIGNRGGLELNTIYLIGCHSCVPGIEETFKEAFPKTEIKHKLNYIQLDETTELIYPYAIGLALRAVLPEVNENDINLLPQNKKEELEERKVTPVIRRYLLGTCIMLGGLLILSGIFTSKTYLGYRVSSQELSLLEEKAMNPYLREAAQEIQQETQLANQILSIVEGAVPGSKTMKIFDNYNTNGITLVNVNYSINTNKEIEIRLRAKASSRSAIEEFILELESSPYFTEVISPLSNLVGKGERFINIDLKLNANEIINEHEKEKEEAETKVMQDSENKPKQPSIQQPAEE